MNIDRIEPRFGNFFSAKDSKTIHVAPPKVQRIAATDFWQEISIKIGEVARLIFVAICWGVFIYSAEFFGLRRTSLLSCASLAYTLHMIIQSS